MLPRSSANVRSGRSAASCARRRTDPVPIARAGREVVEASTRRARRAGRPAPAPRRARASAGAIGGQVLGRVHRDVGVDRRAPPAAPPSRTRRCRRARGSATSVSRSPRGRHDHELGRSLRAARRPVRPATGRARCPGWRRAAAPGQSSGSGRRDARRAGRTASPSASAYSSPRAVPAASFRRTVGSCSSLLTMPLGERLDRVARRGVERVELGPEPLELGDADRRRRARAAT